MKRVHHEFTTRERKYVDENIQGENCKLSRNKGFWMA